MIRENPFLLIKYSFPYVIQLYFLGWDRGSRLNDILEGHDLVVLNDILEGHDLVVLTMSRSVIFGDTVRPACLPELNFYPAGKDYN